MAYVDIVFAQGDDADEPLRLLEEDSVTAAIEYLAQWDYGDDDEITAESRPGREDRQEQEGNYLLTWNSRIGYIGLERVIPHADYPHEAGRLFDCPACEACCHCVPNATECVYSGKHNGKADSDS